MKLSVTAALVLAAAACAAAAPQASPQCPPRSFSDLRLDGRGSARLDSVDFFQNKWFILAQNPTAAVPETSNFCVTAEYRLLPDGEYQVLNYVNRGGINQTPFQAELRAAVVDGEVRVGPNVPQIPRTAFAPYLVVSAGKFKKTDPGTYTWAIVSNGAPVIPSGTEGLCRPGSTQGGFWLFSRSPKVTKEQRAFIRHEALAKGFDVSLLKDVVQKGCEYIAAPPPSPGGPPGGPPGAGGPPGGPPGPLPPPGTPGGPPAGVGGPPSA